MVHIILIGDDMNQDFLSIFKNINLSSIMGGANKTLGVIKKTIGI